jgi:hypothetical protein
MDCVKQSTGRCTTAHGNGATRDAANTTNPSRPTFPQPTTKAPRTVREAEVRKDDFSEKKPGEGADREP